MITSRRALTSFIAMACLSLATTARAIEDEGFFSQPEPPSHSEDDSASSVSPTMPEKEEERAQDIHEWELQFLVSPLGYSYKESVPSPLKSTESGILPEFSLSVDRNFYQIDHLLHVELCFATGSTTYNGTTQPPGNIVPVVSSTSDKFVEGELDYGFVIWSFGAFSRLRGYLGFTWRYWERFGQYREDYTWHDIPVGLRWENDVSESFSYDVDLSVKPTFGGNITVYFSGLNSSYQNSTGILGSSVGAKLKVPMTFFKQSMLPLVVAPWVEYISFTEGPRFPELDTSNNVVDVVLEPGSSAFRYGVFLGTSFTF